MITRSLIRLIGKNGSLYDRESFLFYARTIYYDKLKFKKNEKLVTSAQFCMTLIKPLNPFFCSFQVIDPFQPNDVLVLHLMILDYFHFRFSGPLFLLVQVYGHVLFQLNFFIKDLFDT